MKRFYFELLLVLAGHFFHTNFIKTSDVVIHSDGKGYYDYLPAITIYHDLNFKFREQAMEYAEANTRHNVTCNNRVINKYTCGMSVLWLPFFGFTHEWLKHGSHVAHNGYSLPYHFAVYMAALFYLFAGLIYLRKLLLLYTQKLLVVRIVQAVILFATNLYIFSYYEASFSHVYSFSLITVFIYAYVQYHQTGRGRYVYAMAFLLALIVLVRPFNTCLVFLLPFFSGGLKPFLSLVRTLIHHRRKQFLWAALIFTALASIQPVIWYIQCGRIFPWTYTNETFHFSDPALWQALFGFKKGLFIYTPVLLLSLGAFIILFRQNKKPAAWALFAGLLLIHYFISSWQTWWYGWSFGLRPWIDYYSVFAVMMVLALGRLSKIYFYAASFFMLACAALNLVQTYQYAKFILLPEDMDFAKYKEVFLRTGEKYILYLPFREYNAIGPGDKPHQVHAWRQEPVVVDKGLWREVAATDYTLHKGFNRLRLNAHVQSGNTDKTAVYIALIDSVGQQVYYNEHILFHFNGRETFNDTLDFYAEYNTPAAQRVKLVFGFAKTTGKVKCRPFNLEIIQTK